MNFATEMFPWQSQPEMGTPIQTARKLRRRMTPHEKVLWQQLRAHRFKGYKFRRQHPIVYQQLEKRKSFYVADFYCASKKLIIELDGKHHQAADQQERDRARDKLLKEFGIKTLRFQNDELADMSRVLIKIEEALDLSRPLSACGEG